MSDTEVIHTMKPTSHFGFVAIEAFFPYPFLIMVVYFSAYFAPAPLDLNPIVIFLSNQYVLIAAVVFFCIRFYLIESSNKKSKYELHADRIEFSDSFLNNRRRTFNLIGAGEVHCHANVYQKLFGIGDIVIEVGGVKGLVKLKDLEDPDTAFKFVAEQVSYINKSGTSWAGLRSAGTSSMVDVE